MGRPLGAVLIALCACAPSPMAAQAPHDSTEREVLLLHREINEAMFRRDPGPLAEAALENLVVVPPGGYLETRDQVIRGAQNFRTDSVAYREREVRVRGNTAVVTAKLMVYGELQGTDPATGQRRTRELTGAPARQMSVFVRQQGRWRLLAQSSTPIRGFGASPRPSSEEAQPDAAPSADLVAVEREVREALEAEQRAFVGGECPSATFFSDDPFLFVVGGRAIQIEEAPAIGRTCESRPADEGTRPRRTTERHDVHVLGPNAAHTVTHYANQVTRPDGTIASYPSVVTKIWARQGDTWRIVHFHESAARPADALLDGVEGAADPERQAVEAVVRGYLDAFTAQDPELMGDLLTEDFVVIENGYPISLERATEGMDPRRPIEMEYRLDNLQIEMGGELAVYRFDLGWFADGEQVDWGLETGHARRIDGEWKLAQNHMTFLPVRTHLRVATLRDYVGDYEGLDFQGGEDRIRIYLDDGRLFMTRPDGRPLIGGILRLGMLPDPAGGFFVEILNGRVEFETGPTGDVSGLTYIPTPEQNPAYRSSLWYEKVE